MTEQNNDAAERLAKAKHAKRAAAAARASTGYRVKAGCSISCLRGIVGPGSPIGPLDFVKDASQREIGEKRLKEKIPGHIEPEPSAKPEPEPDNQANNNNGGNQGSSSQGSKNKGATKANN